MSKQLSKAMIKDKNDIIYDDEYYLGKDPRKTEYYKKNKKDKFNYYYDKDMKTKFVLNKKGDKR
ncbi:MAG TPA: hypothetical protein VMZ91_01550 [Candidatus Paceibacterota bacterium]|nr:hypothetical protein [Candidatus Paceibacterota bacterium]